MPGQPKPDSGVRRDSTRSARDGIAAVRRELSRGCRALRFEPGLEYEYRTHLNRVARGNRIALLVIAALALLAAPFFDRTVFALPAAAASAVWWVKWAWMLPCVLAAIGWCGWRGREAAGETMMTLVFLALTAGLVACRVLLHGYGIDFPLEFVGVAFVCVVALARIRTWVLLPVALFSTLPVVAVEAWLIDPPAGAAFHLAATAILALVAVYIQLVSDYSLRRFWLDRRLLELASRRDSVTGLLNRQALDRSLTVAHAHASREGLGYAVAMIDIDDFGLYNDTYGHPAGDRALREIARTIDAHARRPLDVCGRYGGEEFTALWFGENAAQLTGHAERLREAVQALCIEHCGANAANWLTVSIGLCFVAAPRSSDSLGAVVARADRQLYRAKAQGRNRVSSSTLHRCARRRKRAARPAAAS